MNDDMDDRMEAQEAEYEMGIDQQHEDARRISELEARITALEQQLAAETEKREAAERLADDNLEAAFRLGFSAGLETGTLTERISRGIRDGLSAETLDRLKACRDSAQLDCDRRRWWRLPSRNDFGAFRASLESAALDKAKDEVESALSAPANGGGE